MIFDDNQISVIKAPPGPLLVTAGPGSGKTAVLTQRIVYLKKECNISYDKILVITFTKAAAAEMKSRFEAENGKDSKVTFCTFHSLFYSIIRDFKSDNFSVISHSEKLNILKTVLLDQSLDVSRLDLEEILEEISKVKNLDCDLSCYTANSLDSDKFSKICRLYLEEITARKLIDYDDFVITAVKLFKENPSFFDKWRKRFDYCLIDEFQDINLRQYEIVKMLFGGKSVFAVGDEDQSIYAFRGSSSEICLKFKKDFNANVLKLEINYRSSKSIVEAGMKLISANSLRFDKTIRPSKNAGKGNFKIMSFESNKDEYETIVKEAKNDILNGKSAALLLRTNNIPDSLLYYLLKEKVPFITEKTDISKKNSMFADDINAYFKLSQREYTYENLLKIVNKPNRFIARNFLAECKARERADDGTFNFVTLYKCAIDKQYLAVSIFKLERNLKELCKLDSFEGLLYIMNVIGYKEYLNEKNIKYETEYESLKALAREFAVKEDFIDYFEMNKSIEENVGENTKEDSKEKLNICTIHASKGREWDSVYIPDVNEGNIPHKKACTKEETEEERRLFYVAMTRAREKLWIAYTEDIKKNAKPSVFIGDIAK